MKYFFVLFLLFTACATPLKPQPSGTTEISGTQGRGKFWITKIFPAPVCTLWYFPGVDETENPALSGKYPHPELLPMAKKLGCNVASFSYGTVWLLDADVLPKKPLCWFTGGCDLGPSIAEFLADMKALEERYNLPKRRYASGVSQGGFNLSTLAMKYPERFVKVLVAHPVMRHRGVNLLMNALVKGSFSNFDAVNPVTLIKSTPAITPIYVSSCKADKFVPSDAAQEFARLCKARGFDCTLHIDKSGCKHGAFDSAPAIAWMAK